MYNIHLLPGSYGDAVLIEYGTKEAPFYILMDGGPYYNFDELVAGLKCKAPGIKKIELLIVTHIDIDHIDGVLRLLNQKDLNIIIDNIWFNGYNQLKPLLPKGLLGYDQGDFLSMLIADLSIPHNQLSFGGKAIMVEDYTNLPEINLPGGMCLVLLGPSKEALSRQAIDWKNESKYIDDIDKLREDFQDDNRYTDLGVLGDGLDIPTLQEAAEVADTSLANESSIAFIATFKGKNCLFAADAPSDILLRAIKPLVEKSGIDRLVIDAWKIAHHGSKKSTLNKLMEKVDAEYILVCSDGAKYGHPNQETLAKLLKHKVRPIGFYFNYRTQFNEKWDDEKLKEEFTYTTFYPPEGTNGITLYLNNKPEPQG